MSSKAQEFTLHHATDLPLEGERLTDRICFGKDGNVSFHWSDFREACRLWQTRIAIEPALRKDYEKRLREMEKLRSLPLWIRNGKTTTQTNLFDVYEGFICEQHWQGDDMLARQQYEISLISPSGPFKQMPITNCFNLQTYRDFVMVFLLQDKLPRRDFRLRVKCKLLAEFGPGFSETALVELEQMTAGGLIVRLPAQAYYGEMVPHQQVRLLFGSQCLGPATQAKDAEGMRQEIGQWATHPFYTLDKTESFVFSCKDVSTSARFDGEATQDCFLRIGHDIIRESNPLLVQRLEKFIKNGQKAILEMLEKRHAA